MVDCVARTPTRFHLDSITFSTPGRVTHRIFIELPFGYFSSCRYRMLCATAVLQARMMIVHPRSINDSTPEITKLLISGEGRSPYGQCFESQKYSMSSSGNNLRNSCITWSPPIPESKNQSLPIHFLERVYLLAYSLF